MSSHLNARIYKWLPHVIALAGVIAAVWASERQVAFRATFFPMPMCFHGRCDCRAPVTTR